MSGFSFGSSSSPFSFSTTPSSSSSTSGSFAFGFSFASNPNSTSSAPPSSSFPFSSASSSASFSSSHFYSAASAPPPPSPSASSTAPFGFASSPFGSTSSAAAFSATTPLFGSSSLFRSYTCSASSASRTRSTSVPAFDVSSPASTASTANAASSGSEGSFTVVDVTDSMAPSGTTTSATAFSFSTPASSIPVLSSITTPAFGVSTSASAAPATSISITTAGQTSSSLVVASTSGTTLSVSASVTAAPKLPSEIKGKTVEEIIKEWNAKLQERTEKFRKQANAIADWDRRILQNHDVLLRLETEAAKVVETHANLVRQLESIETHQQEVDKALQSMEGKAERIYKDEHGLLLDDEAPSTRDAMYEQAESTERELEQMTKQLKSIIQSLNSSQDLMLTESYQNGELQSLDGMNINPLDSVVEILNSQLTSLMWIDEKESINPNVDQPLTCTVSSKGTYDMDDVVKARKLIEEMTPSLEENRKMLLRKVFVKYPNLMNMHLDWWPELIVHLFRTLSSLLVLMTDTSPSIMDDASKRILVLMIGELELHNFDNTFISDMKDLVSKAWESHLVSDNLREEAKKLQAYTLLKACWSVKKALLYRSNPT